MIEEAADRSTVVMGAAIGQGVEQTAPFLTSLRRAGYAGDVVLFVDARLARALRRHPSASGVELVEVRQWPPFRFGLLSRSRLTRLVWTPLRTGAWLAMILLTRLPVGEELGLRLQLPFAQIACTPMDVRFLHYHGYLMRHPYRRVLISDVRDVLFQADPFSQMPDSGLAVSIETASYTIATEPHNAEWLTRAYGPSALAEIGDNPPSCVGVTYGEGLAMTAYLKLMATEIISIPPARAGIGGSDTAVHNFLLWTNRAGRFHRMETLTSSVATLNGIDADEIRLGPDGQLLNVDGTVPSVLHQYDRLPGIGPKLLRTFAC